MKSTSYDIVRRAYDRIRSITINLRSSASIKDPTYDFFRLIPPTYVLLKQPTDLIMIAHDCLRYNLAWYKNVFF